MPEETARIDPEAIAPFDQERWLGSPPWLRGGSAAELDIIERVDDWERAHGHDVRLKCYAEFGCQAIEVALDRAEARVKELEDGIATHREHAAHCPAIVGEACAAEDFALWSLLPTDGKDAGEVVCPGPASPQTMHRDVPNPACPECGEG